MFSSEMGGGWGMVPEGTTRLRKGKKAKSQLRNEAGIRKYIQETVITMILELGWT